MIMGGTLIVLLLLFVPVVIVTSYVYVSKRHYERAHLRKKAKHYLRRKKL